MDAQSSPLALVACLCLTGLLTACAAPPPLKEEPKPVGVEAPKGKAPLDPKLFGAPITETAATPLTTIAAEPAKFSGKTVRTEGVVTAVCQSMGCWMDVGD